MTKQDIENMPAGREMDALIAEKVMDWKPCYIVKHQFGMALISQHLKKEDAEAACEKGDEMIESQPPKYSSDITAAWLVVEKLLNNKLWTFNLEVTGSGNPIQCVEASFSYPSEDEECVSTANTADEPLAICRAALMTKLEQ